MSYVRLDTSRNSSTLSGSDKENNNINPHSLDVGSVVQCGDTDHGSNKVKVEIVSMICSLL